MARSVGLTGRAGDEESHKKTRAYRQAERDRPAMAKRVARSTPTGGLELLKHLSVLRYLPSRERAQAGAAAS